MLYLKIKTDFTIFVFKNRINHLFKDYRETSLISHEELFLSKVIWSELFQKIVENRKLTHIASILEVIICILSQLFDP